MIRGVRSPEEARGLGISRRLMVRVGALLKQGVEITAALLETARPASALEALLLDPAVLDQARELDEELLKRLAAPHFQAGAASQWEVPIVAVTPDGPRVICLREELEAGDAWESGPAGEGPAAAESGSPAAGRELAPVSAVPARPLVARLAQTSARGEVLFTPIELDRLRLKLVTSAEPAERIEALRLLAYAPLPPGDKAEVVFRALEDRDAGVRAEGAALLFVLGVSDELTEALRGVSEGGESARTQGAARVAKLLTAETPPLAKAAAAVCALAALRAEGSDSMAARLLEVLIPSAPALAQAPARMAELVRVVVGLLTGALAKGASPAAADKLYSPAQRLLRGLCQAAPDPMRPLLAAEREKTTERAVEAFLLLALLESGVEGTAEEAQLLRAGARFLATDTEEGRDSRAVGMSLAQYGETSLELLADVFPEATPGAQRYLLRLCDDLVRYKQISARGKARFAEMVQRALDSTQRATRIAAMACRGITAPDVPEELRERLAEGFLNSIRELGFSTDIELAEDTVALLGLPAIGPLSRRLVSERPADQRVQAVRVLGRLGLELKPPHGQMDRTQQAVTDLLRRLQALAAEESFPDRRALLTAMGKLVACPAASREAAEVVTRCLREAAGAADPQRKMEALEGLTWVASSRRAGPELIECAVKELRQVLAQAQTELKAHTRETEAGTLVEIEADTVAIELVPVALQGVSRIARSRNCPPNLLRELVGLLAERWREILSGKLMWGPGNSLFLVQALQEIGSHQELPEDLRLVILKALAPRLMYAPVLPAIAAILSAADNWGSAGVALAMGLAITARRGDEGEYDAEDRADILRALGRIAARKCLGSREPRNQDKAQRFREAVVDDLFRGAQDLTPGAYEMLLKLREAKVLTPEAQAKLERRFSEFHALALPVAKDEG